MSIYIDTERVYWPICEQPGCDWEGEATSHALDAEQDGAAHEKNHDKGNDDE